MAKKNKIGQLNRCLTLGANIGVVLGLIILIVEVRQNAKLTRASMEISKNSLLADIELNIAKPEISNVWIKSIRNPENLTDSEMRTVEALLVSLMLQWDIRFKMEDAGLASRGEARQHILNNAKFYFGSQFTRQWWSLQNSGWDGTPMMEVAGPIVEAVDENFLADYMDNLRIAPNGNPQDTSLEANEIKREARRFMAAYGDDLRARDAAALANRYDRNGAYMILNGKKTFRSFEEINTRYKEQWTGPTSFEWFDLTYTVTDENSVLVRGQFNWGTKSGTQRFSYIGLLKREKGKLHILLEDEATIEKLKGKLTHE